MVKKSFFEEKSYVSYHSNGQKKFEGSFKDGKLNGLCTSWYENGQKETEGKYKVGEGYGLWNIWYENGQKKSEATFKDGKLISHNRWNEDGSVKE